MRACVCVCTHIHVPACRKGGVSHQALVAEYDGSYRPRSSKACKRMFEEVKPEQHSSTQLAF